MMNFEIAIMGVGVVTKFHVVRKPGPDGSFDYDGETGAIYHWTSWRPDPEGGLRVEQYTSHEVAHDPVDGPEMLALRVLQDWVTLRKSERKEECRS